METIDPFKKSTVQKVDVMNELSAKVETSEDNPLNVAFPSVLINGTGTNLSLRTNPINTASWSFVKPTVNGSYNVCIGSCVASNQGASVVVPLNIVYYNVSLAKLNSLLDSITSNLPLLFPAGSTIRYTYSTMDINQNFSFYVASVQ